MRRSIVVGLLLVCVLMPPQAAAEVDGGFDEDTQTMWVRVTIEDGVGSLVLDGGVVVERRPATPGEVWGRFCSWLGAYGGDASRVKSESHEVSAGVVRARGLNPLGEYVRLSVSCVLEDEGVLRDVPGSPATLLVRMTDPPPVVVAVEGLRERLEEVLKVPVPGVMAPPVDRGVVNFETLLWVENPWEVVRVEESYALGVLWTEMVPVVTVWDMGDGSEVFSCDGVGTVWEPGGGDPEPGDCTHTFSEASFVTDEGVFSGGVGIVWWYRDGFDWADGPVDVADAGQDTVWTGIDWRVGEIISVLQPTH